MALAVFVEEGLLEGSYLGCKALKSRIVGVGMGLVGYGFENRSLIVEYGSCKVLAKFLLGCCRVLVGYRASGVFQQYYKALICLWRV